MNKTMVLYRLGILRFTKVKNIVDFKKHITLIYNEKKLW